MMQRSGLGPVFAFEWLTRSRRWQAYALRGLFVLALLLGLWMVWQTAMASASLTTSAATGRGRASRFSSR